MNPIFLELIFDSHDCALVGIESRDEIEDVLEEKIEASGLGVVSGGGGGVGKYNIDVDIYDEVELGNVISLIRKLLVSLNVPRSSKIIRHKPTREEFLIYSDSPPPHEQS